MLPVLLNSVTAVQSYFQQLSRLQQSLQQGGGAQNDGTKPKGKLKRMAAIYDRSATGFEQLYNFAVEVRHSAHRSNQHASVFLKCHLPETSSWGEFI
eukprot:SAG11_NODE_753_length_7341_cov_4.014637_2_plen_97_part_00